MKLARVSHEALRPAATNRGTVTDHGTGAYGTLGGAATESVLTAGASRAFRLQTALPAREHRIDDDAIADIPRSRRRPGFRYDTHILMAEREWKRTERLERE
jgi:hypothetical protein